LFASRTFDAKALVLACASTSAELSRWVEQYSLGELFRSGEGAAPAALGTLGSGNLVSTA